MTPARRAPPPTLSVVAPVYNEHASLPEFVRRMTAVLTGLGETWELVIVDDGSGDGSTQILEGLAAGDRRIRPVIFSRNFGHQIAATAGLYLLARSMAAIQAIAAGPLVEPSVAQRVARFCVDAVALLLPRLDAVTRTEWLLYGAPDAAAFAGPMGALVVYLALLTAAGLFDFYRRNA